MSLTYIREYADDGALYSEANASPGSSLADLLDRERPAIKVALELAAGIAEILSIAEEDGKKHGDPKIGHVRVDSLGNTALTDFRTSRRTTRAPEPKPVGQASDIYGLGVILHSLLDESPFGRLPKTEAEHDAAIQDKILSYRLGSAEGQPWTQELRDFLCSMLAFSPEKRPSADDVIDVLGNASDTLEGDNLGDWARKVGEASAPQARQKATAAPEEELEGVRTVHKTPVETEHAPQPEDKTVPQAKPPRVLEPDPETELAAPIISELGSDVDTLDDANANALDEDLDETILDSPSIADEILAFQQDQTRIDELPVDALGDTTVPEDEISIHDQETLLGENLLHKAALEEARQNKSPDSTITSLNEAFPERPDETEIAPKSTAVIKGPSLPPPPPKPEGTKKEGSNNMWVMILIALGVGAYLFTQNQGDSEDDTAQQEHGETTESRVDGGEDASGSEDTANPPGVTDPMEAGTEKEPSPQIKDRKSDRDLEESEELSSREQELKNLLKEQEARNVESEGDFELDNDDFDAEEAPAKIEQKPKKEKPAPVSKPKTSRPQAPPAPAPPTPSAGPYRIKLDIAGSERKIVCGDGQNPTIAGTLMMTFESVQFCRIEIDGAMGPLNISSSGTYRCSNNGGAVACQKIR